MTICCDKTLYQVGALCGFIDKVYQSPHTISELANKGNLAIGTFDLVHGELIAYDGHFYRIIEDGIARKAECNHTTPFAWVVDFEETHTFELKNITSFEAFSNAFDALMPSENYIYAYRFQCPIKHIKYRSEACQPRPLKPLSETLAALQSNFQLSKINGVMVGFRFPKYLSMLNVPGHHIHFLVPDSMQGGHVFNMAFAHAHISVCAIKNYQLALIDSDLFSTLKIDSQQIDKATHSIEKFK